MTLKSVDPHELKWILAEDRAVLVDIREPHEFGNWEWSLRRRMRREKLMDAAEE